MDGKSFCGYLIPDISLSTKLLNYVLTHGWITDLEEMNHLDNTDESPTVYLPIILSKTVVWTSQLLDLAFFVSRFWLSTHLHIGT